MVILFLNPAIQSPACMVDGVMTLLLHRWWALSRIPLWGILLIFFSLIFPNHNPNPLSGHFCRDSASGNVVSIQCHIHTAIKYMHIK